MTCIAGIVHGGDVWMGADSAGCAGWTISDIRDSKIFRSGPFLIGITSSFRMGQLLRYSLKQPIHPVRMTYGEYMCTRFVNAVRKCFKAGGFATKEDGQESGGKFLVGYGGHLSRVEDNYQVLTTRDGFDAVGCGDELALASLFTTRKTKMKPVARLRLALQAAEKFSIGVRRPFHIMRLRKGSTR